MFLWRWFRVNLVYQHQGFDQQRLNSFQKRNLPIYLPVSMMILGARFDDFAEAQDYAKNNSLNINVYMIRQTVFLSFIAYT